METSAIKKMPLKRISEQELKAFFFIAQPIEVKEQQGVHCVFAYEMETALAKIEKMIPPTIFIKESGSINVKELFKGVEIEELQKPVQKVEFKVPPTKEQFILNLKLVANDFITDKKEKAKLLKIIEKL